MARGRDRAVLKIQLRPLPFPEDEIIKDIEAQNRSTLIGPPKVLPIKPWFEPPVPDARGYYKEAFEHFREIAGSSRHKHISSEQVAENRSAWSRILGIDIASDRQYWFNLLEKCATTTMLDLGAGEWSPEETAEKARLLEVWQELFVWIIREKFNLLT